LQEVPQGYIVAGSVTTEYVDQGTMLRGEKRREGICLGKERRFSLCE